MKNYFIKPKKYMKQINFGFLYVLIEVFPFQTNFLLSQKTVNGQRRFRTSFCRRMIDLIEHLNH